jgi:cytoskeletal protein CcmA (bactofilin family)
MGATYTRQSSATIIDGATIEAAHFNLEFDALLAAFAASTGHTHDGTAAEGGPITKLLGNTLTFGAGTAGTDISITFDGESNDGTLKWMEDEDYFEFSDDILVASTEKIQFRDTAIFINSSADGQLDLVADTEIQIAATTVDINGNADISGNLGIGGNLTVTGTTTFNGGTLTLGDANTDNIVFGGEVDSDIIPDDDDTHDLGSSSKEWKDIYIDGTAYLDAINFNGTAITSTAAELNIVDGGTSATSTTVADADRVVLNDNGTMVQVAVTDLAAYFDDEITAMPNLVTTAATTVGALNSGSITSGFGTIDTGSSTITTTGLISGGSLDIDDVVVNGTTIGHTDDTDLLTLTSGVLTVAGEVSMTTLDIGGTNVTSTAAELNLLDGITAGTVSASLAVIADSNKDITGFRNVTLTGELDAGSLDISGDADIDGTLEADAITINGTTLAETISDTVGAMVGSNTETGIAVSYDDADNTLDFVLGSSQTTITSLTNTSLVVGRDADNDIDFSTDNTILFRAEGADQIKLVNGAIVPVTDNDIDLGTSSLEFKDAYFDGTVTADAFAGPLTGNVTGNASGTAATVTEAAQSNITSLGTLTTLTVDNIIVNGTTIGHTDDTDLITLADGIATVAGEISVTTLDIGGTNVTSTAAELNIIDGNTSATSTTLADADRLVTNDNGTMVQVALSDVKTYLSSAGFSQEDPTALAIALG